MNKVKRAIIMAAGLGTRMKPVTLETPKPLIKVNGIRMIDTVIDALHKMEYMKYTSWLVTSKTDSVNF